LVRFLLLFGENEGGGNRGEQRLSFLGCSVGVLCWKGRWNQLMFLVCFEEAGCLDYSSRWEDDFVRGWKRKRMWEVRIPSALNPWIRLQVVK
jgi:hypothetical protein